MHERFCFFNEKEIFDNFMSVYNMLENLFRNERIEVVTRNGLSPCIDSNILNLINSED